MGTFQQPPMFDNVRQCSAKITLFTCHCELLAQECAAWHSRGLLTEMFINSPVTVIFLLKSVLQGIHEIFILSSVYNVAPSLPSENRPHLTVTGQTDQTGVSITYTHRFLKTNFENSTITCSRRWLERFFMMHL